MRNIPNLYLLNPTAFSNFFSCGNQQHLWMLPWRSPVLQTGLLNLRESVTCPNAHFILMTYKLESGCKSQESLNMNALD